MLKGLTLFYLLSMLTRNPFLALLLLVVLYAVVDRAYIGLLPDFFAPFRRNNRIKTLVGKVQVNPADAESAQELGVLYFEKKHYKESLRYLEKAREKVDNSARLFLYLGMACMELGLPEEGKKTLDKAVALERRVGYGLPYIYLLQYELNSGGSSILIKDLEEGVSNFANTENFFRTGLIYQRYGDRQKARQMYQKALNEYSYVPKRMRRIHRRWALLARMHLLIT